LACKTQIYPATKERCYGNHFWLSMAYNFGCMIASDTLFDSRGRFLGSSSEVDIAEIECLGVVAMATNFGTKIAINWLYVNDRD